MTSINYTASPTSYTGNYYTMITAVRGNKGQSWDMQGTISITDGSQTKTAKIIQYCSPYLKNFGLQPTQVPQLGGTLTYALISHYPVVFQNVPSYVTIRIGNTVVTQNQKYTPSVAEDVAITYYNHADYVENVLISFDTNNTGADRTTTGTFCMKHYSGDTIVDEPVYINTLQYGEVKENITVSPGSIYIPQTGGSVTFSVASTALWNITSNIPSWLSLSQTSGTSGVTNITATISTTATSARAYNLTFSTSDSNAYLGVRQMYNDELAFTAQDSGSVYWYASDSSYTKTIEYSKNGGAWTSITSSTGGTLVGSVVSGDVVRFRGNNVAYALSDTKYNHFYTTATIAISGYLTSLINPDSYMDVYELEVGHNFQRLFYDNETIVNAADLKIPSTKLSPYCYSEMFENTNITSAPSFPMNMKPDGSYVLSLAEGCCEGMFRDCAYLSSISALYVDTLVQGCFRDMFAYCSSLNRVVCMANNPSSDYTSNWLNGVADQGTFVCKSTANWESGVSGIPQGWQIEEV